MAILQSMLTGKSTAELEEMVRKLAAENDKLRTASRGKLHLKVSEKGAVSLFGMGKWPVTLYREQWERIFAAREQIEAFIEANADSLSVKE